MESRLMDTIRPEVTGRRSNLKISSAGIGRAYDGGGQGLKPLGLSIKETAAMTSESEWQVKEHLRRGEYRAKKSGRRTIIIYQSVEDHWNSLPDATFKPSKRKHIEQELTSSER
jgi:hypothetical protein